MDGRSRRAKPINPFRVTSEIFFQMHDCHGCKDMQTKQTEAAHELNNTILNTSDYRILRDWDYTYNTIYDSTLRWQDLRSICRVDHSCHLSQDLENSSCRFRYKKNILNFHEFPEPYNLTVTSHNNITTRFDCITNSTR